MTAPICSPVLFRFDGLPITEHDVARFWAKVDRRGPKECWPWKGKPNGNGYGRLHIGGAKGGRHVLANRLALAIHLGKPFEGGALHNCDNPICVNAAAHLRPGTQIENIREASAKGRMQSGKKHMMLNLAAVAIDQPDFKLKPNDNVNMGI